MADGILDVMWNEDQHEYRVSGWIFLRVLGVIYLVAFASLGSQVMGLIGSHGLLPAHLLLDANITTFGPLERFWRWPAIFWLWDGDTALRVGIGVGLAASALLILNVAPRVCCVVLWAVYLSFTNVGQDFFTFQWDILLLETGFLSIFFTPSHGWKGGRGEREPPRLVRWLLVLLLIRLNLESGISKWASGDETWRRLTAMDFYYETAPIPTVLGWWAHHLPHGVQALSVLGTFVVEIIVPLALFGPRKIRILGALALIGFQIFIGLTANYGFFNLITIALCLLVLDDAFWCRWVKRLQRVRERLARPATPALFRVHPAVSYGLFAAMALLPLMCFLGFTGEGSLRKRTVAVVRPFHSINSYGLFANMTLERWEVEILGSVDGVHWKAYPFRYKAGALDRRPPFVAPHQPRLDFQCWFLTFDGSGDFRQSRYLSRLLMRISAGDRVAKSLLEADPFPDGGPKFLQVKVHRYQMTTLEEKQRTGNYWKIVETRDWSPVMSCDGK